MQHRTNMFLTSSSSTFSSEQCVFSLICKWFWAKSNERNKCKSFFLGCLWLFNVCVCVCAGWSFSMGSAYQFHSWRVFVVVCALPCVSAVVALTFMPESPRFYLEVMKVCMITCVPNCVILVLFKRIVHPKMKTHPQHPLPTLVLF